MNPIANPQLSLAYDFVENTGQNIFLTGKAGTGKTTFLHNLRSKTLKRTVVVAPTGVAAINAGGVTIHSFFQLAFGPHIPDFARQSMAPNDSERGIKKFSREKINIIRSLDLLVIDEISMVRADMLDAVDEVLRRYRHTDKAFGGVQLLMIGDIQQLAPVVKDDEWDLLRKYYDTMFFFSSRALKQTSFVSIELKHIYRQADNNFVNLLNKIRDNRLDREAAEMLNQRYKPGFEPNENDGYITLTTHNSTAKGINAARLEKLQVKTKSFTAEIKGDFPEYMYPTEFELILKAGAQVMFVKNDSGAEKKFYNGKIGKITRFNDEVILVRCPNETDDIEVERLEWQNMRYSLNDETKEISETVIGSFIQYPLKLAWAITIHKSQGLTFNKAIIDANASFAHGQVYVALSRCTSIEGLVLSSPIYESSIKTDNSVAGFSNNIENNPVNEQHLHNAHLQYQKQLLTELFNFSKTPIALYQCIKLVKENQSALQPGMYDKLSQINQSFKAEISDVAEKFQLQLEQILCLPESPEKTEQLNLRVSKAAVWFSEKLKTGIAASVNKITIESDNKAVRKSVTNALNEFLTALKIKITGLEACHNGFELKKFRKAIALAAIDEERPHAAPAKQQEAEGAGHVEHPKLYNTLKQWRNIQAETANMPVYNILQLKTMAELANQLPSTIGQLKKIHGIGKAKIHEFGQEILEIIYEYCQEQNIERPEPGTSEAEIIINDKKPAKEKKENTKLISFTLLKEGKNIDEIAAIRGLTNGTIEGHLAHYIATGDISITELMPQEKIDTISNFFITNKTSMLADAKAALGDNFGWGELRLVQKHLEFTNFVNK